MSEFPQRLRSIRIARGKKQREVAEYLGMKTRSYQFYEGGEREPPIDKLIAIADYLDVTIDELVGRDRTAPRAGQS